MNEPYDFSEQKPLNRCISESKIKRIIKKVIGKKLKDGTMIPVEITKTIIQEDGSRNTYVD